MNSLQDPVTHTIEIYGERNLNCAQSVLKGFQAAMNIPEERIAEAKAHGGGRAEEGRCGALHSAISLAQDDEARTRIACAFSEAAGAESCREIKRIGKFSCADCVALAAKLLAGK